MPSVCVYCGSRNGDQPAYVEAARSLGQLLAVRKITLIYGGARLGLMGTLADSVLNNDGKVIGIMPECLVEHEVAHEGLTELITVDAMHTRKVMMIEKADGFITLPGGFGTLDELFETLTLRQLQQHNKPCGLLNINGYYDALIAFLDHAAQSGFISPIDRQRIQASHDSFTLLTSMMG